MPSRVDTNAPLHQNGYMRLTVNLEPDLYALAKSLAKSEDCTISAAVNRLLRRSLPRGAKEGSRGSVRPTKRNGFVISRGRRPITADTVRQNRGGDVETGPGCWMAMCGWGTRWVPPLATAVLIGG